MANEPSTISISTTPAPEGNNSSNQSSSIRPLPAIESGVNPSSPDKPQRSMIQKIGNTTYELTFHFSTTSKETMGDKIARLIRHDLDAS